MEVNRAPDTKIEFIEVIQSFVIWSPNYSGNSPFLLCTPEYVRLKRNDQIEQLGSFWVPRQSRRPQRLRPAQYEQVVS